MFRGVEIGELQMNIKQSTKPWMGEAQRLMATLHVMQVEGLALDDQLQE